MPPRNKIILLCIGVVVIAGGAWYGLNSWETSNVEEILDLPDPSPEQITIIVGALFHSDFNIAARAEEKLKELGPKSLDPLVNYARDTGKDAKERVIAAQQAMMIDPSATLPVFKELAADSDTSMRQYVAGTLLYPEWRDIEGVGELLCSFEYDEDLQILITIADKLGTFPSEVTKATLERLSKHSDPDVSRHAARELRGQAMRERAMRGRR